MEDDDNKLRMQRLKIEEQRVKNRGLELKIHEVKLSSRRQHGGQRQRGGAALNYQIEAD